MNTNIKSKLRGLENVLEIVCGIAVEITFARVNMITIAWEGENKDAFDKLQKYFKGKLYGYDYDLECDQTICCLDLVK